MTPQKPDEIRELAEAGDPDAQFKWGCLLHSGLPGGTPDLEQARLFWERAAYQNHAGALVNLGAYHAHLVTLAGGVADPAKAALYYRRAAEAGNVPAMTALGQMLLDGEGVPADADAALSWLDAAAEAGDARAMNTLGQACLSGRDVPQDKVRGAWWYRRAAEAGDPLGQYNFAVCLLRGDAVERDPLRAADLLRQAAEQGDAQAALRLGILLAEGGPGLTADPEEGFRWVRAAAQRGHAGALFEVGQCYRLGRGCPRNARLALDSYRLAAEQDHADAQFSLAMMLAEGEGCEDGPRPDLAEPWYHQATFNGHGGAAHNLGILYAKGRGVAQDLEMARELFAHAIGLGDDAALFSMGLLLSRLPKPDLVEAAMWAILSANRQPHGNGKALLEALAAAMSAEQMAAARSRAETWKREYKPLAFVIPGDPVA